ncbi:DM13 domain-containing protein [Pontiellaceae bacterium B12227]|nr:DM13 domain-containing protein [Pontiellaceae bacterium B12227]
MKNKDIRTLFFATAAALIAHTGEGSAPKLSVSGVIPDGLNLSVSNLSAGATYYIEQTDNLSSNDWKEVHHFEGLPGSTNWVATLDSSGFYRAVRDPYHAKVGQSASLDVPGFHDVSGTAHIVNNRTVELRNFNFDGGGIVIEVYVSPNPSFSPYVSISDDLFGTVFNNETLVLEIPDGANLDDFNYISIWCVAAGVSFGDGPFQ